MCVRVRGSSPQTGVVPVGARAPPGEDVDSSGCTDSCSSPCDLASPAS